MGYLRSLFDSLVKQWFLVGLVGVIALARAAPFIGQTGGILHPELTVKYIAVIVIFFNSGLSIRSEEFGRAILQVKIHTFVQLFTFVFVPVVAMIVVHFLFLFSSINPWLLRGFLVVSCMPPPVSSAVIIVKAIGGNEAAAIFNSAFGSMLGIFITPMLLFFSVSVSSSVPIVAAVVSLTCTVVVPLLVGQFVRLKFWRLIEPLGIPFGEISSGMLLLVIFATFCDTFARQSSVSHSEILLVIAMVVVSQVALLACVFLFSTQTIPFVSRHLGKLRHTLVTGESGGSLDAAPAFSRSDIVCLLFCSTHKSLTLGIPLLKILFGSHPYFHLVSFPLLVYHPVQIVLGGLLVPTVRKWFLQDPSSARTRGSPPDFSLVRVLSPELSSDAK